MATIVGLSNLAAPASGALMWITDTSATPQDRNHSVSQLAKNIKKLNQEFVIDTGGGAISLTAWQTANLVLTYAGASTVTLPEASTCIGYRVRIMAGYAGAALVTITPHTGDHIDLLAANVSIFLNNSDASANVQKFRHVELMAIASGYWAVIGGDFNPDQAVDTDGSHLNLGRLHHLPLNNTTVRGPTINLSSLSEGAWTSAQSIAGSYGVPSKAKVIRASVYVSAYDAGGAFVAFLLSFSDNNANTPDVNTAHPCIGSNGTGGTVATSEIDIPLNSSGQLYIYAKTKSAVIDVLSITIAVTGYYMGD